MIKVFLGGTCNESTWRDELIKMLEIDHFNPVVDDWTPECMAEEIRQRELCDYCLYVITPEMTGVYSIAEAIDDSNKRPGRTIFCVLTSHNGAEFSLGQIRSLQSVGEMVERNGGRFFTSLIEVAHYLNTKIIVKYTKTIKMIGCMNAEMQHEIDAIETAQKWHVWCKNARNKGIIK